MARIDIRVLLAGLLVGGVAGSGIGRYLAEPSLAPAPIPAPTTVIHQQDDTYAQLQEQQITITYQLAELTDAIQHLQSEIAQHNARLAQASAANEAEISSFTPATVTTQLNDTSAPESLEETTRLLTLTNNLDDPSYREHFTIHDLNRELQTLPAELQKQLLHKISTLLEQGAIDPIGFAP